MIEGQKIALLIFTMLIGVGGLVLRNYLYGTFDMGSKVGTIGLIAIFSAFLLGSSLSALYPETVHTFFAVFR